MSNSCVNVLNRDICICTCTKPWYCILLSILFSSLAADTRCFLSKSLDTAFCCPFCLLLLLLTPDVSSQKALILHSVVHSAFFSCCWHQMFPLKKPWYCILLSFCLLLLLLTLDVSSHKALILHSVVHSVFFSCCWHQMFPLTKPWYCILLSILSPSLAVDTRCFLSQSLDTAFCCPFCLLLLLLTPDISSQKALILHSVVHSVFFSCCWHQMFPLKKPWYCILLSFCLLLLLTPDVSSHKTLILHSVVHSVFFSCCWHQMFPLTRPWYCILLSILSPSLAADIWCFLRQSLDTALCCPFCLLLFLLCFLSQNLDAAFCCPFCLLLLLLTPDVSSHKALLLHSVVHSVSSCCWHLMFPLKKPWYCVLLSILSSSLAADTGCFLSQSLDTAFCCPFCLLLLLLTPDVSSHKALILHSVVHSVSFSCCWHQMFPVTKPWYCILLSILSSSLAADTRYFLSKSLDTAFCCPFCFLLLLLTPDVSSQKALILHSVVILSSLAADTRCFLSQNLDTAFCCPFCLLLLLLTPDVSSHKALILHSVVHSVSFSCCWHLMLPPTKPWYCIMLSILSPSLPAMFPLTKPWCCILLSILSSSLAADTRCFLSQSLVTAFCCPFRLLLLLTSDVSSQKALILRSVVHSVFFSCCWHRMFPLTKPWYCILLSILPSSPAADTRCFLSKNLDTAFCCHSVSSCCWHQMFPLTKPLYCILLSILSPSLAADTKCFPSRHLTDT